MAFQGEAWQQILTPFLQGIDGSLTGDADELPWLQDANVLDPFVTFEESRQLRQKAEKGGDDLRRIVPGATGREARTGPRQGITATGGTFSLEDWQSSVENARIPEGVLAKVPGTNFLMEPHAASALGAMFRAAAAAGINLSIGNTYRDWAAQAAAFHDPTKSAPVAEPGTSNHGWGLAVDIASVGDREFEWLRKNAGRFGFSNPWVSGRGDMDSVEPWHWEYGQSGDTPTFEQAGAPKAPPKRSKQPQETQQVGLTLAPMALADGPLAFASVMDAIFAPDSVPVATEKRKLFRGQGGKTLTQLRNGFIDSGRPDLARMVGTKDFKAWIDAEGGFNPETVSQHFPGHGVNYGIFQFWEGHEWTQQYVQGNRFTATPYQQAQFVAKYFGHLTPDKIREYADAVRAGTYSGWG